MQLKLSEADRARGMETFEQLLSTGKSDFNVADVDPSYGFQYTFLFSLFKDVI